MQRRNGAPQHGSARDRNRTALRDRIQRVPQIPMLRRIAPKPKPSVLIVNTPPIQNFPGRRQNHRLRRRRRPRQGHQPVSRIMNLRASKSIILRMLLQHAVAGVRLHIHHPKRHLLRRIPPNDPIDLRSIRIGDRTIVRHKKQHRRLRPRAGNRTPRSRKINGDRRTRRGRRHGGQADHRQNGRKTGRIHKFHSAIDVNL